MSPAPIHRAPWKTTPRSSLHRPRLFDPAAHPSTGPPMPAPPWTTSRTASSPSPTCTRRVPRGAARPQMLRRRGPGRTPAPQRCEVAALRPRSASSTMPTRTLLASRPPRVALPDSHRRRGVRDSDPEVLAEAMAIVASTSTSVFRPPRRLLPPRNGSDGDTHVLDDPKQQRPLPPTCCTGDP
ncbi:hypothetical protein BDA96_04G102600 [Sorghum bicolor]|uniref:Uncharacterized protein n=1 Tax=Sorghum bicolor TaxID=4558 RepID=A0A921R3B0_SORBI|nr:hypothetical protein BDA96_10G181700 [Sorghum bicolor]KAG0532370.1 hypothetical protein BDA96_04G102600 [Sorghum bicolor]